MVRILGGALFAVVLIASCVVAAQDRVKPVDWPVAPPVATQRPVTETFFGTTLSDPYRNMETSGDAETLAWMRAQAAFTRSILDAIPHGQPISIASANSAPHSGSSRTMRRLADAPFTWSARRGARPSISWCASRMGARASSSMSPP
jgi:hypothetical protein